MKSALSYERYAHGEPPDSPSEEESSLIRKIALADEEFLKRHPPASFLRDLGRKRRRRSAARLGAAGAALAACAAIALLAPALLGPGDGTRMKGSELGMFVYHRTDTGTEILEADAALAEGDEIQIAYYAGYRGYAAILSVDGRGKITRHMPLHGSRALAIQTEDYALLPYSYRLDDAPLFEDLYFVVSPRPFSIDELETFLAAGPDGGSAGARLPARYRYATLRIKKTEAQE